jgi:hypothetical protein
MTRELCILLYLSRFETPRQTRSLSISAFTAPPMPFAVEKALNIFFKEVGMVV